MKSKSLIDSGPLFALFDKDDKYHKRALRFLKQYDGEFYSTLAVVTEVCYLLDFSTQAQIHFLTWIRDGAVSIVDLDLKDLSRIIQLTEKYSDLPMDFADSTLVAIGERLDIFNIASIDSDFYIYRSSRKQAFMNIFLT
ncbi:MAG: type II toxin-antitoxin system VapC family toxin [Proteobacteria bacterium]|nr:type II toxin-antitoxin system VapC family toxin [Pseudomonadota bacterium]